MKRIQYSNMNRGYLFPEPELGNKRSITQQTSFRTLCKQKQTFNWFVTLLVFPVLVLSGCSKEEPVREIKGDSHISVQTGKVIPQNLSGKLNCFGVLESANEVMVNVDFSAPVFEVMVHEGQKVLKGDLLLRFDTAKLELMYQQTKAALSQEESALENHRITKRRIEKLLRSGTVSQQEADDTRSAYKAALGRVIASQNGLKLLERDLEYSEVHSPIDAIVNVKMVEAGQNTIAYQPLIMLEAVNSLHVSVYVGENAVSHLRVGAPARVKTVAGTVESKINSIGAKSDLQTGNFEVKLLVDNSEGFLKPGMTADVELILHSLKNKLVIPQTSLSVRQGRYVVFHVVDGLAIERDVEVAMDYGDQIIVTKGLSGGETLIVGGSEKLRDGAQVEVIR